MLSMSQIRALLPILYATVLLLTSLIWLFSLRNCFTEPAITAEVLAVRKVPGNPRRWRNLDIRVETPAGRREQVVMVKDSAFRPRDTVVVVRRTDGETFQALDELRLEVGVALAVTAAVGTGLFYLVRRYRRQSAASAE